MKTFTFIALFPIIAFSQQKENPFILKPKSDSVLENQFKLPEFKNNLITKDSMAYKIMVKPIENPELYSIRINKPKVEVIPIPNAKKDQKPAFEYFGKETPIKEKEK